MRCGKISSMSDRIPPMMPHQVEGVEFLRRAGGRAMLADGMGLGKTRTAIEYLKAERLRATVVTTKSFLYGWKAEVERWWPEAVVCVVEGGKPYDAHADVFVTTYDRLRRVEGCSLYGGTCAVLDESHKLMNAKTKRSKAARELVKRKEQVICLTGTPMPNAQPQQLWHQMLLVGPKFVSWPDFRDRFCDPHQEWAGYLGRYVWDYTGATDVEGLKQLIAPRFLRRTKALLKLPPLTESYVPVPVKLQREDGEAWTTYAQRLAVATVPHTVSLVKDVVERGSKVIVFTSSIEAREKIRSQVLCTFLNAKMSSADREEQVNLFQRSSIPVFVSTTPLAAEGLTLTAADVIVYNDLPWTPGLLDQSTARAHRKGQTKPVHVYKMETDTRYAKVVRSSLEHKQSVSASLLEERV